MKGFITLSFVCVTIVLVSLIMGSHQLAMYEEFNRQYLAAQVLEAELQHRYNDQNITLKVYEPSIGFL